MGFNVFLKIESPLLFDILDRFDLTGVLLIQPGSLQSN
jgi:hypothetical protein